MRIDAKVATIVSPVQVALNAGSNKGVKTGDLVTVYRRVDVNDPDSKQDLGAVILTKVRLTVSVVYDKFCVAETYEMVDSSAGGVWTTSILSGPVKESVTINPNDANYHTLLIAIGDPVYIEREEKPDKKATAEGAKQPPKPSPAS
jgi:hypothetical protein